MLVLPAQHMRLVHPAKSGLSRDDVVSQRVQLNIAEETRLRRLDPHMWSSTLVAHAAASHALICVAACSPAVLGKTVPPLTVLLAQLVLTGIGCSSQAAFQLLHLLLSTLCSTCKAVEISHDLVQGFELPLYTSLQDFTAGAVGSHLPQQVSDRSSHRLCSRSRLHRKRYQSGSHRSHTKSALAGCGTPGRGPETFRLHTLGCGKLLLQLLHLLGSQMGLVLADPLEAQRLCLQGLSLVSQLLLCLLQLSSIRGPLSLQSGDALAPGSCDALQRAAGHAPQCEPMLQC